MVTELRMRATTRRCMFVSLLLLLLACSQSSYVVPVELLVDDAEYVFYARMHLEDFVLAEYKKEGRFSPERLRAEQITIVNQVLKEGQWRVTWKPDDIVDDEIVFVEFPRGVQATIPIGELPKRLAGGYRIVQVTATGVVGVFKVYQDGVVIICWTEEYLDDPNFKSIAALANYDVPRNRDIQC